MPGCTSFRLNAGHDQRGEAAGKEALVAFAQVFAGIATHALSEGPAEDAAVKAAALPVGHRRTPEPSAAAPHPGSLPPCGRHVVIAESDGVLRRLIERMLRLASFSCECVGGGERLAARLREGGFDAVVLDLGLDGALDAAHALAGSHPEVLRRSIALVSILDAAAPEEDGRWFAVARKPIDLQRLQWLVTACLEARGA